MNSFSEEPAELEDIANENIGNRRQAELKTVHVVLTHNEIRRERMAKTCINLSASN